MEKCLPPGYFVDSQEPINLITNRNRMCSSYGDGVAVYWIANLVEAQIEVYTQPSGVVRSPDYGSEIVDHRGDAVPIVIDETMIGIINVAALLP